MPNPRMRLGASLSALAAASLAAYGSAQAAGARPGPEGAPAQAQAAELELPPAPASPASTVTSARHQTQVLVVPLQLPERHCLFELQEAPLGRLGWHVFVPFWHQCTLSQCDSMLHSLKEVLGYSPRYRQGI